MLLLIVEKEYMGHKKALLVWSQCGPEEIMWMLMAGLSLTASPVTLGQSSNLSESQFPRG